MVSLGQAHETELTLTKAGATEEFWVRLAQNLELAKAVVALVMNTVFRLTAKIDRDMEGWTCVEPVEANEGEFKPSLHEFFEAGDNGFCGGEETIRRAKERGVLTGLRHAEAMLRNQEKIPVEWRKHYLVFPEVWQNPAGDRCVFCLYWASGCWYLNYDWLVCGFVSSARLVGSRK